MSREFISKLPGNESFQQKMEKLLPFHMRWYKVMSRKRGRDYFKVTLQDYNRWRKTFTRMALYQWRRQEFILIMPVLLPAAGTLSMSIIVFKNIFFYWGGGCAPPQNPPRTPPPHCYNWHTTTLTLTLTLLPGGYFIILLLPAAATLSMSIIVFKNIFLLGRRLGPLPQTSPPHPTTSLI